ncbi:NAD(P)/FAD-dependent oxidoreductase [Brevibacterium sandarakinum]|uniref:NAD(P)/FAD-dependent oxidoreductase n=1 Tax=Brevibacterium sandarakinum TaxID=629680 RepID=UPI00264F279F|nr:NAD(P)/FAD-dependent oxidoreductase [Brevibacterium sandarakinum]MDN5657828.1 NAD(P)/FAD-dependent oxidoreductase [Brevibacterium sandarakinum]
MSESHSTPQNQQKLIAEVAVIGGGAGGLAASIALARSLRSVIVIDAGSPRNAPSAHAHNVLGHEGVNPLDLVARGRQEAEAYGVQFLDASVISAQHDGQAPESLGFVLETSAGVSIEAKRIVIATGLTDVLPEIPGLADGWGETVIHCPYCHGYEVRGENIGIIGTTAMSYHQAMMFSQLSDRVTFLRHDAPGPDGPQKKMLESLGIAYVDAAVEAVVRTDAGTDVSLRSNRAGADSDHGTGTDSSLSDMTFEALAVGPYFRANSEIYEQLGGTVVDHPTGMGSSIPAQANGATDVPGVWAVGNSADISAMVVASAASGVMVGAQINAELIMSSVS